MDFLKRLQSAIDIRSSDEFQSTRWTSEQWLVALAGEVGELCNFVKKDWRDHNVDPVDIENEVADILIYLVAFAIHKGIDLESVTIRKFNITSEKRGYVTKL